MLRPTLVGEIVATRDGVSPRPCWCGIGRIKGRFRAGARSASPFDRCGPASGTLGGRGAVWGIDALCDGRVSSSKKRFGYGRIAKDTV